MIATDPQIIPEDRKQIGVVIIIVMATNIIFAVGIMMNDSIRETIRQCKMKKKRKLAVKMAKERKAARQLKATMQQRPPDVVDDARPEVTEIMLKTLNMPKAKGRDEE